MALRPGDRGGDAWHGHCVDRARLATAACAFGSGNRISEGQEGAPGVRRVLLCPPNLVLALRSEIQSGSNPVDHEVVAYLETQGREVARIGVIEGRDHWKQAVAEAKAAGSLTSAAGIFVGRLAKDHEFDAVVKPSLILVQTRLAAGNASWDGVSRRMRMLNAPAKPIGREDSTLAKGIAYGGISGPAWVTSLHVLVYTRSGQRVFEGRGGIDFLHELDLLDETRRFLPNSSIFQDRARLHEGVVQAFAPYLLPPDLEEEVGSFAKLPGVGPGAGARRCTRSPARGPRRAAAG
jgi:hypothetical protein